MSELKILTVLELRSLYGINKFLHTRDRRERSRGRLLIGAWAILIAMVFFYIGGLVYGLSALGLSSIVPAYLAVIASLLILAFGIFKAGNYIFSLKGYDVLASLPVKPESIVISRFLALYAEDLILTLAIFLPGLAVFAVCQQPGIGFYLTALALVPFLPAIPLVISTLIGTLIIALSSGVKNKSLVQTLLSLALVVIVLIGSFGAGDLAEEITLDQLAALANTVSGLLGSIYPPALWLNRGMMTLDFGSLVLFVAVSALAMIAMVFAVSRNFHRIARRLSSFSAGRTYKIGAMESRSILKALYLREAKRYFSSGVYVTNTIIGPIMGTIMAGGLFFAGLDTVQAAIALDITPILPFAIAAAFCMMTTTAPSISLEGRQFWIVRSLPISAKALFDSKILLNLSLMLPFYLVSEAFLILAVKPGIRELMGFLLVPLAVMLFSVVLGITVDLKFHRFDWESEAAVVKQGASAALGGFAGPLVSLLLGGAALLSGAQLAPIVSAAACAALLIATALLYRKNNTADLITL